MKRNWNLPRLTATGFALALGVGCGGISGSHSISPATFLLPGLGSTGSVSTNATTLAAVQ